MKRRATRVLDAILEAPWAIKPEWLRTITDIAQRHELDPETLQQRLGRPLDNTRSVTVRDGVAVVPVIGPIFPRANMLTELSGATSLSILATDLRKALDDPNVSAVLLEIDSPGGFASGVQEMGDIIFEARGEKRVVAYVSGMGASAAYWIASAAEEVVVNASALVGSIGVVVGMSVQETPDRDGYRDFEIVSSNAPNKRPDPRTDEGLGEIRAELDALEAEFVGAVARNRGVDRATVLSDFGAGGLKVGIAAVNAGMADRVGTMEQLIAEMAQEANGVRSARSNVATVRAGPLDPPVDPAWIRGTLIPAIGEALDDGVQIRPGVAARAKTGNAAPATRQQAMTEDEMDLKNLTAEQLKAERPDLVAAIEQAAAAEATEEASAAAEKKGFTDGYAEGVAAERARIAGLEAASLPGFEALLAEAKADGKSTDVDLMRRQTEAQKEAGAAHLTARKAESAALAGKLPAPSATRDPTAGGDDGRPLKERAREAWEADPALRSEFKTFETYVAWRQVEERKQARAA